MDVTKAINVELNRSVAILREEAFKDYELKISQSTENANPWAPRDPNLHFKKKLCDLQIQVLERSKRISELQGELLDALNTNNNNALKTPELVELRKTLETVQINRSGVNNYGYGKDVMRIACDTVDSIKNIVGQITEDGSSEIEEKKVVRSYSENSRAATAISQEEDSKKRPRSKSTKAVLVPAGERKRDDQPVIDIRALSNLGI